jgi:hypothetical protein
MRVSLLAGFAFGVLFLAGCQSPDVGQPCGPLDIPGTEGPVTADYLETGRTECDSLACMKSPAPSTALKSANPYCTKPCAGDADCYPDETGLKCLDLIPGLSAADQHKFAAGIQGGKYCKIPPPGP